MPFTTTLPPRPRLARRRSVMLAVAGLALTGIGATTAAGAATTPTTPGRPAGTPNRSAADGAFCKQLTDSQAAIGKATGDAKAKFTATAAEWVKIEAVAPSGIKSLVTQVRTAYESAAQSGDAATVKAVGVANAGARITDYVSANCGGGGGRDGGPGFDDPQRQAAFAAYRACLEKNGVKLPAFGNNGPAAGAQPGARPTVPAGQKPAAGAPAPGPGGRGPLGGLDPNDPKVAAAVKACANLAPQFGRGGPGGPGGLDIEKIRACLTKKGVTLPTVPNAASGNGGANRQPPAIDDKTRKAFEECRQQQQQTSKT